MFVLHDTFSSETTFWVTQISLFLWP